METENKVEWKQRDNDESPSIKRQKMKKERRKNTVAVERM